MLTHITLTGIDHTTAPHHLLWLAENFPLVEFGILYTANPRGRMRYPDAERITFLGRHLYGRARLALHVCGLDARDELVSGALHRMVWAFDRVQVNGAIDAGAVTQLCGMLPNKTVITQDSGHGTLWREVVAPNHAILMDASGGRGELPPAWRRQPTEKPCGFAGGLNPETLPVELPRIMRVAQGDWWIDAENGLRDRLDRFCMERAKQFLETVELITDAELQEGR